VNQFAVLSQQGLDVLHCMKIRRKKKLTAEEQEEWDKVVVLIFCSEAIKIMYHYY
jgi:hypothetical protein